MRKSLIFLAGVALALGILTGSASAGFVVFSDDFSSNTTLSYTWVEEGGGGDNLLSRPQPRLGRELSPMKGCSLNRTLS